MKPIKSVKELRELKHSDDRLIGIGCEKLSAKEYRVFYYFSPAEGKEIEMYYIDVKQMAEIMTISDIYPAADLFEREVNESFGVYFQGNKNMGKRAFIPEELMGKYPRK